MNEAVDRNLEFDCLSKKTCRVCWRKCVSYDLFRNEDEMSKKLMAFANVEISEGDGLPSCICSSCHNLVNVSYNFKCQVEKADAQMRSLLSRVSSSQNITTLPSSASLDPETLTTKNLQSCKTGTDQTFSHENTFCNKDNISIEEHKCIVEKSSISHEKPDILDDLKKRLFEAKSDEEETPLISRTRQKCWKCRKTFLSRIALQRHVMLHENKEKLGSQSETSNPETHDEMRKESCKEGKQNEKNDKFECKVCSKRFKYQKSFATHAKTHRECKDDSNAIKSDTIKREKCKEEEDTESGEDDIFCENEQCKICGKVFATKRNLKRHVMTTHSGLKYNCSMCGKRFSRGDKLREHEQSKHKEELYGRSENEDSEDCTDDENKLGGAESKKKEKSRRPHKCSLCSKAFAQAQSLTNHLERHKRTKDTQKRFLCEVCSKSFAQSGSLIAHLRTHTGIKPYICNVCGRAFTKSTYLQLHMRTHSGEKPYICQYCSRAFARANTLARHITVHTGETKYHCKVCNKSFRRLTSLNEHTYTHTGQRPYACKICTKRYNNAGSLYAHTKKCKAQQLSRQNPTYQTVPMEENNPQNNEGSVSQMFVFAQKKMDSEEVMVGQAMPTPQFMITNIHNQKASNVITNNVIQPFGVDDPNMYAINAKQMKTSYYTIYPNM